jgi:hypothetical protein
VPGRVKAIWLLALAVVRTLLRLLFRRSRQGIAAFRANYDADRLPPVSAEERAELGTFGRCIACGLCDRGEGERIRASEGAYRGVMALMLADSRNMPDFRAAALSFQHVPDSVLAEKERICPTRVPMRRMARFVRTKARELSRSLPALQPAPREPPAAVRASGRPSDQIRPEEPKSETGAERL